MNEGYILRGTTPLLTIKLKPQDLSVTQIEALEWTFRQGNTILKKKLSDCIVDTENNTVSYHFLERETLMFGTSASVKFQLRFKVDGEIIGTKESKLTFTELLSDSEFEDEEPEEVDDNGDGDNDDIDNYDF